MTFWLLQICVLSLWLNPKPFWLRTWSDPFTWQMQTCSVFDFLCILKVLTFKLFKNTILMDAISSWNFVLICHIQKSWDLLSLLVLKFLCSYHNLKVTEAHWQDKDSFTSNSIIPFNCLESTSDHFIKGKQVSLLLPKILANTRKRGGDSSESEKNRSYMFLLKFPKIWTIRKTCCFGLF